MSNGNLFLPSTQQQPSLKPVIALAGTTIDWDNVSPTFVAANQIIGNVYHRSNATVAMTDILPNPQGRQGNKEALPNGWNITVMNKDASATLTLNPVGSVLINGAATLVIAAGKGAYVYCDGTQYFSTILSVT